MTTTAALPTPALPTASCDAFSLACRQVEAIDAWHARRRQRQAVPTSALDGREAGIDRRWRSEVLRREYAAIIAHCAAHLRSSGDALWHGRPRAVVVHRHPWAGERVADALRGRGVQVVAVLDNGADAVGAVVVEQPELLVLSDVLPMVSSLEVVGEARALAPATRTAVLVEQQSRARDVAEAGATLALPHTMPWEQAADAVLAMHAMAPT